MNDARRLCADLLRADSGDEVVGILKDNRYWDDAGLWRYYGDVENNWGQSGNQQSLAEAALAEKIVNSVDARLIGECRALGIDPSGPDAPRSIRSAVARFFEDGSGENGAMRGQFENWSAKKIREIAEGITLTATGARPDQLNITISDCGEGQTPDRLPDTILSLNRSNKQNIAFVQGQFNQGGTGALRFCGKENLQLVISRRNPALLDEGASARDREWCFTIVRREYPTGEPGSRRNSAYTYLAPIGAEREPRRGSVLSFAADGFPFHPDENGPYGREAGHGTAIKLYEYNFIGSRSNIIRGRSLKSRLDLLLPKIALPLRVYEYRKNSSGNYLDANRGATLTGLLRRIGDGMNVEKGFPVRIPFQPSGQKLTAEVFAFAPEDSQNLGAGSGGAPSSSRRSGSARGHLGREGIVFILNGQTQGHLSRDFFRRDAVKMKPIADDLLVFVDCDKMSGIAREDLFMTSRDRLTDNRFKRDLELSLENALRDCRELRDLRNRRQQERVRRRIEDEKELNDILQSLIRKSPNLTALFHLGRRITAPFDARTPGEDEDDEFKGEYYPTYFRNRNRKYGETLNRECPVNRPMQLVFETNAANDYFTRHAHRGEFELKCADDDGEERVISMYGPVLDNGVAAVVVELPDDADVGDRFEFVAMTTNEAHEPFVNRIAVSVAPASEKGGNDAGKREDPGDRKVSSRKRDSEMDTPKIRRVYREDWDAEGFDEFAAMKIKSIGYVDNEKTELYEFMINMNNAPLENEAKSKRLSNADTHLLRENFLYANVLVGLSLLLDEKQGRSGEKPGRDAAQAETVEERVERVCRALAPFVPTLIALGSLGAETNGGGDLEGRS